VDPDPVWEKVIFWWVYNQFFGVKMTQYPGRKQFGSRTGEIRIRDPE
jgi:hypothetical protein